MNNKEMQIKELANEIARACPDLVQDNCDGKSCVSCLVEKLYNAGYRKADEVEKEVVKAILYDFDKRCPNSSIGRSLWMDRIRREYGVEVDE